MIDCPPIEYVYTIPTNENNAKFFMNDDGDYILIVHDHVFEVPYLLHSLYCDCVDEGFWY